MDKPCELPCPKCGGEDIHRKFLARGAKWPTENYATVAGRFRGANNYTAYSTRDHLNHHCRTCGFEWQTLPLPRPKKTPTTSALGVG